jgi:excisionase family DNA binding protein
VATPAKPASRNRTERRRSDLPPDLVNVPEAARRLGIHSESLYRLIRAGNFAPAIHIGRQVRVSVPLLERFKHGDQS